MFHSFLSGQYVLLKGSCDLAHCGSFVFALPSLPEGLHHLMPNVVTTFKMACLLFPLTHSAQRSSKHRFQHLPHLSS